MKRETKNNQTQNKNAIKEKAIKEEKKHFVYILECNDTTLYTGWTTDLDNRINRHNQGAGAKYTRGRLPVKLVYSETFQTKEEALRREHGIKKLKRSEKKKLINGGVHGTSNGSRI